MIEKPCLILQEPKEQEICRQCGFEANKEYSKAREFTYLDFHKQWV